MFSTSDYGFIKSGIDAREAFSLQKETDYPTLRIQPSSYKTANQGEYIVGVTIYQNELEGCCTHVKEHEINDIFRTYESTCNFLRKIGYFEKRGKIQQITIYDILN